MEHYCAGDIFAWLSKLTHFENCYTDTCEMRSPMGPWHCTSARCLFLVALFLTVRVTDRRNIVPLSPRTQENMARKKECGTAAVQHNHAARMDMALDNCAQRACPNDVRR